MNAAKITHRRVLAIAVPIVLSNATVPILGAVDTGVVGQLGEAAPIGAVGIGAIIITAIYWIFGFLRMGTTGLVAQARGKGDNAETGALLMRSLIIAVLGGLALILLQIPLFFGAFQLSPASAEVETLARSYMAIRVWSAPAAISVFALSGWLIAHERTRSVFVLQVWMNGLNILLDLWFVLGLGWGVEGVAIATVIAEVSGAAIGLWLCRAAFGGDQWRDWVRILNREKFILFGRVNADILIRSLLLEAAFVSFLFIAGDLGDVTLAANQILLQFLHITAYALDGFAFAAEALVGTAFGAGRRDELRRSSLFTSIWAAGSALLLALIFAGFGERIVDVMATAPEVRAEARSYLPWMIAAPILGFPAWMLDGIFIGATRTRDMRIAMLWSLAVFVAAAVVLVPQFENHGLWAALMILFVIRAITLGARYPALEAAAIKE